MVPEFSMFFVFFSRLEYSLELIHPAKDSQGHKLSFYLYRGSDFRLFLKYHNWRGAKFKNISKQFWTIPWKFPFEIHSQEILSLNT